jgi:hypothetical protein
MCENPPDSRAPPHRPSRRERDGPRGSPTLGPQSAGLSPYLERQDGETLTGPPTRVSPYQDSSGSARPNTFGRNSCARPLQLVVTALTAGGFAEITRPFESSTAYARCANDHAAGRTRTAEAGVIGGRFLRTRTHDPAAVVISPQSAQRGRFTTGSGHPRGSFSRQYLAWGRAQGRPKGSRVEFGRRWESDRRVTGVEYAAKAPVNRALRGHERMRMFIENEEPALSPERRDVSVRLPE